jgi:hypothetical protein
MSSLVPIGFGLVRPTPEDVFLSHGHSIYVASTGATAIIDRDRAVGLLVDVDPNRDHHEGVSSLPEKGRLGRPADTPQWGRGHAPIKSRRSALTSGERHNPWMPAPQSGTESVSQPTAGQDPNHRNQELRRLAH